MNQLVFIVEDDPAINKILSIFFKGKDIPFVVAPNLPDAIALFELNKEVISYIAIDGNLTHDHVSDLPETLVLARIIADSQGFKGTTFAMSLIPEHCNILKETIGDRCEIHHSECHSSLKFDTIREIIRRITEKREKDKKH